MDNIPNTFVIDFTQVLNVWVTLKFVAIAGTGLYASFGKGDGLNRLFKVIVFGVLVYMLTGCVGPDDSIISQSKTQQAMVQAQAAQVQQQANALQASGNQAVQANASAQTAMANAQIQASEASKAQAQEGIAQANAQAQLGIAQTNANANIVSNALVALDNAADRQAQQLIFYNVVVAIGMIAIMILAVLYMKWRFAQIEIDRTPKNPARLLQGKPPTDRELLQMASAAGYLVVKKENGYSEVRHPKTNQVISRQQLLEAKE
jgi:hypothetical protein